MSLANIKTREPRNTAASHHLASSVELADKPRMIQIGTRLDENLHDRLRVHCAVSHKKMSSIFNELVKKYLDEVGA